MSTNYMNKAALTKLTKSQLVELLLKMNSEIEKIQNQIVKQQPEPRKPTPAPRKNVKQMVQDYEENIITPPVPLPRTKKVAPVPLPRTKKPVPLPRTKKPVPLPRKNVKQMVQDYEENTEQAKQTADVLIFQRCDNEKDIPEGRKIAFKDHNGKPYILRLRRYFIINKIIEPTKYINRRIYDYYDNNNKRLDFDNVVEFLNTSEDFKLFNKDYINCIIIKSLTNEENINNVNDLLDEDLFMSKEEYGVFSRYIKINKNTKSVNDNSCFIKIIVNRFQDAFIKAHKHNSYKFDLTIETLCDLYGIEFKNENIGLSINKSLAFFKKFHLGLYVYGPFGSIFKYKPEKRNKHLNPSNLFIYYIKQPLLRNQRKCKGI